MSAALTAVTRATKRRERTCGTAYQDYLAAIVAARDHGHTLEQIADAAGITKAGVHYLLNPDRRKGKA